MTQEAAQRAHKRGECGTGAPNSAGHWDRVIIPNSEVCSLWEVRCERYTRSWRNWSRWWAVGAKQPLQLEAVSEARHQARKLLSIFSECFQILQVVESFFLEGRAQDAQAVAIKKSLHG